MVGRIPGCSWDQLQPLEQTPQRLFNEVPAFGDPGFLWKDRMFSRPGDRTRGIYSRRAIDRAFGVAMGERMA